MAERHPPNRNGGDDEIDLTEIFGRGAYERAAPIDRPFKPWHKPRKQYIRREQWAVQAEKLLAGRPPGRPLRYFGLPGADLLDIRYLHGKVCSPSQRGLVFLGMNTSAKNGNPDELAQNASLYDVRNLAGVHPDSQVISDDFRRFSDPDSVAWERARDLGPFDIVNLDLCEGFTTDDPEATESYYRAIAEVAEYQFRHPDPWVLLITTRVARSSFNAKVRSYLLKHFKANVERCEAFAAACTACFGEDSGGVDPESCSDDVFLKLMLIAMCKWLLALARGGNTRNGVTLASSQGYRVNQGAAAPDLASVAILFEPAMNAPVHPLLASDGGDSDYCGFAEKIAKRAAAFKDIDLDLAEDIEFSEELTQEMEGLLSFSYDVRGYREWLDHDTSADVGSESSVQDASGSIRSSS